MKYMQHAAIGGIFFILLWGCTSDEKKAAAYFEKGSILLEKGEYTKAESQFRQALKLNAGNIAVHEKLAEVYLKLGNSKEALNAYNKALDLNPGNIAVRLKLARFELLGGNNKKAHEGINTVLSQRPDDLEALKLKADLLEQENRFEESAAVFQKIADLAADQGEKTEAYLGRARNLARLGQPDNAEKVLLEAVDTDTHNIKTRLVLYNFYANTGKPEKAEQVLLQSIQTNPNNSDLYILLGIFYFNRKALDQAEQTLHQAIEIDPNNIKPYLVAAELQVAAGQTDKALAIYEQALAIQPKNLRLRLIIARFYLKNNQLTQAEECIQNILKEQPAYLPALTLKGELLFIKQEYDAAIRLFDQLIQKEPGSDRIHLLMAQAHHLKGDNTAAIDAVHKALAIQPNNINAKLLLSDIYLKEGQFDKAQKINMEIFSMLHQDPAVRIILGNTADVQQRGNEISVDSFDTLFKLASENPVGHLRIGQVEFFRKKYDQLMQNFEAAFNANPKLIGVFTSIILLHAVKDEYDIAIQKCDNEIQLLKDEPALQAIVYNLKGGLYLARNLAEPAESSFRAAIAASPNFLPPYYGLARLYLMNKDVDKAVEQYQALLEKNPNQTGPHMVLGTLYSNLKRFDLAEKHYRTALSINPDFTPAANNLAYLLSEHGNDLEEALRFAVSAKAKKPDDPFIKDTLGWIYYKMGLFPDAIRELSESVEKLPDNAMVNYHLGMAYYKSGANQTAKMRLERALKLNSKFAYAEQAKKILGKL